VDAARRVHHEHVAVLGLRLLERPARDLHGVLLAGLGVDGHLRLLPEPLELLDGRGALQVAGRDGHVLVLLREQLRELGGGGRLARALQPGHQDHGRRARGEGELAARSPHQLGELVVDRLDDGLAGVQGLGDLRALEPLAQGGGEVLDDLEVDIGLEQGETHLAQRLLDVVLRELAARADLAEDTLQPV